MDRLFNKSGSVAAPENPPLPVLSPDLPPALPADLLPEAPLTAEPLPPEEPPPPAGTDEPSAVVETDGPGPSAPAAPPATAPTVASRDRSLYFIEVDSDGAILRTRVSRPMPATSSPMADVLRLLLRGPTVDEQNRGLITLIPPATQLLSAQVRGSTAYISFSEEFQFNTYGVEGYIGQLRQIIWTVTDFPNISDVQILIEGRRIDYLGERIAIGSPLNRTTF